MKSTFDSEFPILKLRRALLNIFIESNYRFILRQVVEQRKGIDSAFSFQTIAEATRITKSYISKVTTGKAHFSADQLFVVCEHLCFTELQIRYTMLLLEHERSTNRRRREALQRELQAIRDQALDSREHLKARPDSLSDDSLRDYYIDPFHQIVHICLSIPRYQSDPVRLASDLDLSVSDLREIIDRLERLGIVEQHAGKIRTLIKSIHLPRASPAFKPWRNQLKLLCLERLSRRSRRDDYSFSVTFSATERVRDKIKSDFLDMLKRTEELVQGARQEETFQMGFDLFSWTGPKG